ncbi:MAG: hypothetical protein WCO63_14440 [Bacteroidota bacterium]
MTTIKRIQKQYNWALVILVFSFSSCATYHVTTQSLLEQLANNQPETKVNMLIVYPYFFFPGVVTGNSMTEIKVLDKNEKECIIPVKRQTSIRITKKDGKCKTFYFDTMLIKDSIVTGKNDHFIGTDIKPIKLNNIKKIEIQKH